MLPPLQWNMPWCKHCGITTTLTDGLCRTCISFRLPRPTCRSCARQIDSITGQMSGICSDCREQIDRLSVPKVDLIAAKVEDPVPPPPTVPTGRRICYWCRGALAVEIRHDVPTCAACIKRKPS